MSDVNWEKISVGTNSSVSDDATSDNSLIESTLNELQINTASTKPPTAHPLLEQFDSMVIKYSIDPTEAFEFRKRLEIYLSSPSTLSIPGIPEGTLYSKEPKQYSNAYSAASSLLSSVFKNMAGTTGDSHNSVLARIAQLEEQFKQERETMAQERETMAQDREMMAQDRALMQDIRIKLHETTKAAKRKYNTLLMGSVAFNFINASVQFVFGVDKYRALKRHIHSYEDLVREPKTAVEETRWKTCKDTYWSVEIQEAIARLKEDRLPYAHPVTITEDSEDTPTPQQLQAIVQELYNNKQSRPLRDAANNLINSLDQLTRLQQRYLLQTL